MRLKPRPFGVSRPSWGQSSAGGTSVVLALPSRGPDLRGVRRRASRVSGGLTNARVVSLCLCEGSRRRGGCRPPRRAGRARTHPAPSDSWCPSGRSPRRGSCPSSRHLCPPAALGRTAPRGTAGRTSGAHTALTTSATRATSSPDRGRGARAGCPLPLRLTAGARGLAQAPCWGDSVEGVPSFRPAFPKGPASRASRDLRGPCRPASGLLWTLCSHGHPELGGDKLVAAQTPADTASGGGQFAAKDPAPAFRLRLPPAQGQPRAFTPRLCAPRADFLQAPGFPHLRKPWGAESASGLMAWGGD